MYTELRKCLIKLLGSTAKNFIEANKKQNKWPKDMRVFVCVLFF